MGLNLLLIPLHSELELIGGVIVANGTLLAGARHTDCTLYVGVRDTRLVCNPVLSQSSVAWLDRNVPPDLDAPSLALTLV